jgi:transposase, IS6 family
MVAERGVEVDASCIGRWAQAYAPELNKRCRPHLKPTNNSYRIDETYITYIKVRGEDEYLYRALDSTGLTIEFLRASASMLARRRKRKKEEQEPESVTSSTISAEEQAEMERAPRAYRCRMMKSLSKQKAI